MKQLIKYVWLLMLTAPLLWASVPESPPSVPEDNIVVHPGETNGVFTGPQNRSSDIIRVGETSPGERPPSFEEIWDIPEDANPIPEPYPCLIGSWPFDADDTPSDESTSDDDEGDIVSSFDVDLFLVPEANDPANNVNWHIGLPTGVPLDQITNSEEEEEGARQGVRIPALSVKPSGKYTDMYYFDIIITGYKPGYIGKTWLGKQLGLDQNPIQFTQRVYCGKEVAWSYTRNMKVRGEPLTMGSDLDMDRGLFQFPAIYLQMRSYDQTAGILTQRSEPAPVEEELPYGADFTDGGDKSGIGVDTLGIMAVACVLIFMGDPTAATAGSAAPTQADYIYEHAISNVHSRY